MKFVVFITSWLCFALTLTIKAQSSQTLLARSNAEERLKDTLIIHLKGDNQVHIIGNSLEDIAKYNQRPDSLKNLFLSDYKKAVAGESISTTSKNIHYLVSKDGKRRMKVGADTYTEEAFNLESEVKRLEMRLPSYHYIIYDLLSAMEIHFYLEDSSSITLLTEVDLDGGLKFLELHKKEVKDNYRINLKNESNIYNIMQKDGSKRNQLELTGNLGFGIFGNQPSPLFGLDLSYTRYNKYSRAGLKVGINYSLFSLINYNENKFININPGIIADVYLSANRTKARNGKQWFGTQWGVFAIADENNKSKYAFQFGFHTTHGNILYSINMIRNKPDNPLWAFTVKLPF